MSRKKYKRRPKFTKNYRLNLQDDFLIEKEPILQNIHTKLAQELFSEITTSFLGDWTIQTEGLTLFVDPELGCQLEINGTSDLPLYQRLTLHLRFFKLLKEGYSILKAVKLCLSTLTKQSIS